MENDLLAFFLSFGGSLLANLVSDWLKKYGKNKKK